MCSSFGGDEHDCVLCEKPALSRSSGREKARCEADIANAFKCMLPLCPSAIFGQFAPITALRNDQRRSGQSSHRRVLHRSECILSISMYCVLFAMICLDVLINTTTNMAPLCPVRPVCDLSHKSYRFHQLSPLTLAVPSHRCSLSHTVSHRSYISCQVLYLHVCVRKQ